MNFCKVRFRAKEPNDVVQVVCGAIMVIQQPASLGAAEGQMPDTVHISCNRRVFGLLGKGSKVLPWGGE